MKLDVIASYPEKNTVHSEKTVGGASYIKTLLNALKKAFTEIEIQIFAEYFSKPAQYSEEGITVKRFWKRGSIISILKLIGELMQSKSTKIVLSLEIFMFGSGFHTFIALLGFLLLKLQGKQIVILMHQVMENFRNIEKNNLKASILNGFKNILYKYILAISDIVIVFEQQLKDQLDSKNSKIVVIPHFVPQLNPLDKTEARKKLDLDVNAWYVLCFGYIAPYKGSDWIVENWNSAGKEKLIMAGGPNPNHVNNPSYSKYVQHVSDMAKQKGIVTTGFIDEKDIPLYFASADAVILPYKTFMSSSGPLSFAFAYEKPVILSEPLRSYLKTTDLSECMKRSDLNESDFIFEFSKEDLEKKIDLIKKHEKKLIEFSKYIKDQRDLKNIALTLYNTLNNHV